MSQSFLFLELFSHPSPLCSPVTASPSHNCSRLLSLFAPQSTYLPSSLQLSLLLLLTTIPPNIHLLILGSFLQLFVQSPTLPSLLPQAVHSPPPWLLPAVSTHSQSDLPQCSRSYISCTTYSWSSFATHSHCLLPVPGPGGLSQYNPFSSHLGLPTPHCR